MSRINYSKFNWVEKKRVILLPDIIRLILDCYLDNVTCCTFLRTNKFWYNHNCQAYYLYKLDGIATQENPANCILIQDTKTKYSIKRKIVNLHDYHCCRLYLDYYYIRTCGYEYTFFGFITDAPLESFLIKKAWYSEICYFSTDNITNYDSCKKIEFQRPSITDTLSVFSTLGDIFAFPLLSITPGVHSEYINGRHPVFKEYNIDVVHTTNQKITIGKRDYFICFITSRPLF